MSEPLPPTLRPRTFAIAELILDVIHITREYVPHDLESLVIYCCALEATMRPLVIGANPPLQYLNDPNPPENLRGSISRRAIADRTGLPRETVRRKTIKLIEAGLLVEDDEGLIRTAQNFGSTEASKTVNAAHAAVLRYHARLRQLGCADEN